MTTKPCRKCSEEKANEELVPRYDRPGKFSNICWTCHRESNKSYYHNNKESRANYNKEWRDSNKDHIKAKSKTYYAENKSHINQYVKGWREANKAVVRAYGAARRAVRKQAVPSWLTEKQMREIDDFYVLARDCEAVSGQAYHVDHIVPLKGVNVCGLHVPWNLQVLPADINLSKHNNYDGWQERTPDPR